jgi:hypothetical protein
MTVRIYSQLSEAAFAPPAIQAMVAAYELTLAELQLIDRDNPITKVVAETILVVYRAGYTTPETICKRALRELGVPLP